MTTTTTYVCAIDQGTTSTRCVVYATSTPREARSYVAIANHQLEHEQRYPAPGWCAHDANEIFENACAAMRAAMGAASVGAGDVACVGMTNQRETTVAWRRSDGTALCDAVVWLDTRTKDMCEEFVRDVCEGDAKKFAPVCGLPVSTYFSAMKMRWLLRHCEAVREARDAGDLCFGTIESWLVYKLTNGKSFITDVTNASRTMLMRLDTLQWDDEMCAAFDVPLEALPKIVSCAEEFGHIDASIDRLGGIAITGCIGDQQSATLGQRCDVGEAKNTYGTGCFMLLNTGSTIVPSKNGLLTTMAWQLGGMDKKPVYALEGSVAIAGAVVHWLRDNLGLITNASDIEELARGVKDAAGVSFVPAFSGLFAPRWRDDARGVIVGLTQYVNKGHIARAALDAIAFQSRDVLEAMRQDIAEATSHQLLTLKVDGGASANNLLMQIQSDVLGLTVIRPADVETTARGAAYAAAVGAGLMTEDDIFRDNKLSSTQDETIDFTPKTSHADRERDYARWNAAVERSYNLAESAPECGV
jgi:glycerol kinase